MFKVDPSPSFPQALDKDTGAFGRVRYQIAPSDQDARLFSVDPDTGSVRVRPGASLPSVPAEMLPVRLVVEARDNPTGAEHNTERTVLMVRWDYIIGERN